MEAGCGGLFQLDQDFISLVNVFCSHSCFYLDISFLPVDVEVSLVPGLLEHHVVDWLDNGNDLGSNFPIHYEICWLPDVLCFCLAF